MELIQTFWKRNISSWESIGQSSAILIVFFLPISTALTTFFAALSALAWFLGPNKKQKFHIFRHHPLMGWVFGLILMTLLGVTYSIGNHESISEMVIDTMRLLLIPIFMYFYQSESVSRLAKWAFVMAMIVTLIFAFLKIYAGLPIGLKYTTGAVFKSHIKTSFFMSIAAFFLALQIKRYPKWRLGLGLCIGLMVYYLFFMSVGRIGYITLVACVLLLAWQWYRVKGILLATVLASAFITGAYFTSPVFHDRINILAQDLDFYHQGGRLLESSLGSRMEFAHTSAALIVQHPIVGWGTGSFKEAYAQHYAEEKTLFTDNPHNEYLRVGVELGLIGVTLLLSLFYQQWRLSRKLIGENRIFCQGVLLSFMIGCFLNSWVTDFTEGYFYCLMTAICFAIYPIKQHKIQSHVTLH